MTNIPPAHERILRCEFPKQGQQRRFLQNPRLWVSRGVLWGMLEPMQPMTYIETAFDVSSDRIQYQQPPWWEPKERIWQDTTYKRMNERTNKRDGSSYPWVDLIRKNSNPESHVRWRHGTPRNDDSFGCLGRIHGTQASVAVPARNPGSDRISCGIGASLESVGRMSHVIWYLHLM